MTIEEKAKAYDEALGWMREMYPCLTDSLREDAKHYFPELTESEDERIRKALVKEFTAKVEKGFEWKDGIPNNAVLAWLEKQKEQMCGSSEIPNTHCEDVEKAARYVYESWMEGTMDDVPLLHWNGKEIWRDTIAYKGEYYIPLSDLEKLPKED